MTPQEQKRIEASLVKRARDGDDAAFEEIVTLYSRRIIAYCHRMAGSGAEDLAQEIFVKLYLALDRFDPQKPLSPFLFRIAHNHCLDVLRKKKVQTVSFMKDDEEEREARHTDGGPDPEELVRRAEVRAAVQQALEALPATYRSAIVMWHVEGMSYEEISETLGLPMGTVKARIHRGREKLQQKLRGLVFT